PNYNSNYGTPYTGYYQTEISGLLTGTADIINAQGQWETATQQAYILQEQDRRGKLENQRKIFDQYLYTRDHAPTFEQERQRFLKEDLARSLNNPPTGEIWSAKALNTILSDLVRRSSKDLSISPDIILDEDVL